MKLIQKVPLVHTPDSLEYIENWITNHPKEERFPLYVVYMMTWNFLAERMNEEILRHFPDAALADEPTPEEETDHDDR